MNLLYMEDGIDTANFGFIRSFKIKDLCRVDFNSDDYEKFILVMRLIPEIYGLEKDFDLIELLFFTSEGENGLENLKFKDDFRFVEEFDISVAFFKGINVIFDKVEVLKNSKSIVLNEKYILNKNNYNEFRDIILRMDNSELFKTKKKIKQEYENPDMKGRFEIYEKHKLIAMRRKIPTYDFMSIVLLTAIGFDKKNYIKNMNIYDFHLAFECLQVEEFYEKEYSKYIGGGDPKKLDLTHWSQKIKNKWSDNIV